MPNLNDISITQGIFEKIKYNYEPVIEYENFDYTGNVRHLQYNIVENELQFERSYEFNIIDMSESERDSVLALSGTNVTFQAYDTLDTYNCTASVYQFYYNENGQKLLSCNVFLRINDVVPSDFWAVATNQKPLDPNPAPPGFWAVATNQKP